MNNIAHGIYEIAKLSCMFITESCQPTSHPILYVDC